MRRAELLIFFVTLSLIIPPVFAQKAGIDSTTKAAQEKEAPAVEERAEIPIAGVLNDQEIRSYRSDFFPINLTQRGRQAASAYRGMPAGLYQFEFAGNRLSNPVTGFWNEQWIPYYQIDRESAPFGGLREIYQPPFPFSSRPVTRVIFSQDYSIGLSFVDINFIQRLTPTNFIQLSGSNFLGDGTEGSDFSQFQINTYRGQLHWQWGQNWKTDFFFWHMRQAFNMFAEDSITTDKFKQIGNIFWVLLQGKLGEKDSLIFVPGYTAVEDRYFRASDKQRHIRYKIGRGHLKYLRKFSSAATIGAEVDGRLMTNKGQIHWTKHNEGDGGALAFFDSESEDYHFSLKGGGYLHSEAGSSALGSAAIEKKIGVRGKIGAAAFYRPQPIPLLWRTIDHDSIPPYSDDHLIRYQGGSAFLKMYLKNPLWLQIEPFAFRAQDYPFFFQDELRWQKTNIENYGVRLLAGWDVWHLQLLNDFSYNHNYKESFAQQISNITTVKISHSLFKNALRLDGVFTWRYVGYFKQIEFQRLLNQYRVGDAEIGPYYIGDFRVQANFRDATVFLIWENLLSEDYYFVRHSQESLRIFRLGIDWVLFD